MQSIVEEESSGKLAYVFDSWEPDMWTSFQVPLERRINRATMATFQFSSGAIGSLTHSLILQGSQYHTAIEIMGDGLHIIIEDPYNANTVLVRRPHSSEYEQVLQLLNLVKLDFVLLWKCIWVACLISVPDVRQYAWVIITQVFWAVKVCSSTDGFAIPVFMVQNVLQFKGRLVHLCRQTWLEQSCNCPISPITVPWLKSLWMIPDSSQACWRTSRAS